MAGLPAPSPLQLVPFFRENPLALSTRVELRPYPRYALAAVDYFLFLQI